MLKSKNKSRVLGADLLQVMPLTVSFVRWGLVVFAPVRAAVYPGWGKTRVRPMPHTHMSPSHREVGKSICAWLQTIIAETNNHLDNSEPFFLSLTYDEQT